MSIYLSESDNKAIGNFIAERQIWVDFLLKYIKKAKNYFEFGAGDYSTVLAANSNLENVYSVETDKTWHTKVKENKDIKKAIAVEKRNQRRRELHKWKKRAKAVGLALLGNGRHSKGSREKWMKELERLEIKKFGKICKY